MSLNEFDILFLVLILLLPLYGLGEGFVREAITLGAALLGLIVAGVQYTRVAEALEPQLHSHYMALLVGFLTVFSAVLLVGVLLAPIITQLLKEPAPARFDRLLGWVCGLMRGATVALVVVLALVAFPAKMETVHHSRIAPHLLTAASYAAYLTPPDVQSRFLEGRTLCEPSSPPRRAAPNSQPQQSLKKLSSGREDATKSQSPVVTLKRT